jgi:Kef-type K+ transport system membrane component KefB
VPHGALAVRVTESIETITVGVLLPLYFALAAGSVNLKLLDNGTTWGLTILLVVCTFVSKFASTTLATKVAGFTWRESMVRAGESACCERS